MDAFTESILARARERQKMLQNYPNPEKTPLQESNLNTICSASQGSLTETLTPQKVHKESLSDSNINISKHTEPKFKENKSEGSLAAFTRQNSKTRISSDITGSPKAQMNTLNIQQDNFNMEIKVTSSENVRVEVEIRPEDSDGETEICQPENALRDESKNKLKRLGKLYAGGEEIDISSPIHRTEGKFYTCEDGSNESKPTERTAKGLKKLAHLAEVINQWEDEIHPPKSCDQPTSSKKIKPPAPKPPSNCESPRKTTLSRSNKPRAPQPPAIEKETFKADVEMLNENDEVSSTTAKVTDELHDSETINEPESDDNKVYSTPQQFPQSPTKAVGANQALSSLKKGENKSVVKSTPKQLKWDEEVISRLESQGFSRTTSSSRLVYAYDSQEREAQQYKAQKQKENATVESKVKQLASVLEEKVQKEEEENMSILKSNSKVNSNISEKSSRFGVVPKKDPALLSVSERKALFEKNQGEALVPKAAFGMAPACKVETVMKASSTKIMGESNTCSSKTESTSKSAQTTRQQPTSMEVSNPIVYIPEKPTAPPLDQAPPVHAYTKSANPLIHSPMKKLPTPSLEKDNTQSIPVGGGLARKMAALLENRATISQEQIQNEIRTQRQKEMDVLLNRFNRNKEVSEKAAEQQAIKLMEDSDSDEDDEVDATEETAMLSSDKHAQIVSPSNKQRFGEKRKGNNKPYSKEDSPVVAAVLDDVKRIKVSPKKKEGRLYPSLSDIETATEDTDQTRTPTPNHGTNGTDHSSFEDNCDSDDPNTSFGRDILEAVCKNQTPVKRPVLDESTASDLSSILDDLEESSSNNEEDAPGPSPPKQVRQFSPQKTGTQPSNSFNYKNFSPNRKQSPNKFKSPVKIRTSPYKSPQKDAAELPEYIVEGDNVLPLIHSVSFYRKQQNQVSTPPVHKIVRQPIIEEDDTSQPDESEEVSAKIAELQEDVHRQQNIIAQTSQALNLCMSTPEFSGSTEQVEAEKVLLVATHRRQAALHELQRLRIEGTLRPQNSKNVPAGKGTLTISGIVIPMKLKYVKALAAAGGKGHHVVCLIKCGEQVVPTKLVSTSVCNVKNPDMEISIPGVVVLNDVYSYFTVTFEVYCLQAQEEYLPHEVKYHINKKSTSKLGTPKKSKQDSRMVMPVRESPAGPQVVRTSSFALMGYVVFSVQAINKKTWNLNNTPPMSPLEGTVEMKIQYELEVSVEYRGFLTMFDDVSGFGAWHRRWCLLKGHLLSYWKYPDDEKKMPPIDTIDLKTCITKEIAPVSREICARMNTLLLERERGALPQDKDSLVTICKGDKTIIRHLLSADTKEERIEWCQKLNSALTALRMWGNSK